MPWLFIIIVSLIILLNLRLRYLSKNFDQSYEREKERYIKDDSESNSARVRSLDETMIIKLTEKDFPFRGDYNKDVKLENDIIRIQKRVALNLEMPIIKTDIKTNTEVKRRFGAATLQTVIDGEENFTRLIQHLNQWAKLLIEFGNAKDAEAVLEKAVWARSDISETYTLLYELYARGSRQTKLDELKKNIDNLPDIAKIRVNKFIDENY